MAGLNKSLADGSRLVSRQSSPSFRVLAADGVGVACPADTNENVLATIVIPAGAMGANGRLRVSMSWQMTNNANAKTGRVRLGGIGGTIVSADSMPSIASLNSQRSIVNRNSQSSQLGSQAGGIGGFSGTSAALTTAAIDTSQETTLVITGQKATAGDTLTLESYCVEVMHQP